MSATAARKSFILPTLAVAGLLVPLESRADEQALRLARDGGAFTVEATIDIEAPAVAVRRVLSDPDFIQVLNPRVRDVEQLSKDAEGVRIRVASRRCVVGFCRDFSWVQQISATPGGDVTVQFERGSASVEGGEMRYRIERLSVLRSRVRVDARIIPSVNLPPLIGPMIMRHTLAEDIRDWAAGIQRLARDDGRLRVAEGPRAGVGALTFE